MKNRYMFYVIKWQKDFRSNRVSANFEGKGEDNKIEIQRGESAKFKVKLV